MFYVDGMADALIGCTGFVGRNLLASRPFEHTFHSRNAPLIQGQSFDQVWCCGLPGTKWAANQDVAGDLRNMQSLQANLASVECGSFVLISTIDVLLVDEPYGQHRRQFEQWVEDKFANTCVVRLPALFGRGLKKNVLFDLLTGHMLDRIHPDDAYQYYDLADLLTDTELALQRGAPEVDLYTEPVETRDVMRLFPGFTPTPQQRSPRRYAYRSAQANLFGREDYVRTAAEVLARIGAFVEAVRAGSMTIGSAAGNG